MSPVSVQPLVRGIELRAGHDHYLHAADGAVANSRRDQNAQPRFHVADLIVELNQAEHQSFVIVTHNEQFAVQSSRQFRMTDGKLVQIKA